MELFSIVELQLFKNIDLVAFKYVHSKKLSTSCFLLQLFMYCDSYSELNSIGVNHPAIVREIPHFSLFPAFFRERPAFLALF